MRTCKRFTGTGQATNRTKTQNAEIKAHFRAAPGSQLVTFDFMDGEVRVLASGSIEKAPKLFADRYARKT
jgi:hypothetical protein